MFALIVILVLIAVLVGMAISVVAFGTGIKRPQIFKHIYYSIEDVGDTEKMAVIYTRKGDYSAVIGFQNPVAKFSADTKSYYDFTAVLDNIVKTLGEGYCIQKQDVFVRRSFDMKKVTSQEDLGEGKFLANSYMKFFDGRKYVTCDTYLIITQEQKKSGLFSFDGTKWNEFTLKVNKVFDILRGQPGIHGVHFLSSNEVREYADRFFAQDFTNSPFSMTNFKVDSEEILMGNKKAKIYSLLDVDDVGLPGTLRPFMDMTVNGSTMPVDIMSEIDRIPDAMSVIYNQVIFIPNQTKEKKALETKKNRCKSIPNPSNQIGAEDIERVQNILERDGKMLVYAHYSLIVTMPMASDTNKVTNQIENILGRQSIHISRRAYNQLELFVGSFPGNSFCLAPDYDRFLTLSDAALCLMYKEHQLHGDTGNFPKCFYTDRQGVPMAIDITGKEGDKEYTNNSNFFVLGPSGSGKSFFMNTVCRQLYEENTDLVIVDTGDSYEGLSAYFNGTYISYSKEKPISMNPFKVTEKEYKENFQEKINFLMSLIILIYKREERASTIEETLIRQVIGEYYQEYFHPFKGFTQTERETERKRLLLESKMNGEFAKFENELEKANGKGVYHVSEEDIEKYSRDKRREEKLEALANDKAATAGERENAERALQRMNLPETVVEGKFLEKIEKEVDRLETQKKKLSVKDLNFNSFFEFALERIPQITNTDKIEKSDFNINNFRTILKPFYRGGELEYTLNNDMDQSLFDEKFIVFEIDKVKDDKTLFPIIVLIIMDVFTQKMRIKGECRKCLVIEEAWKAIATPVMAQYIQYLYKTARKHWAMVGVVTQEIQDIVSSPIVKDTIINNSEVFMLLDQAKFKDKFDDIKDILALSPTDCKKIFTINRLDNKEGRSPFKEVFIKRGSEGDVFGVEEPLECYMAYTTNKIEKEALKLYKRELKCPIQKAIERFVQDMKRGRFKSPLEMSQLVLKQKKVLTFPEKRKSA